MTIGLTGGMGCGKSTAARLFAAHGFRLLDSDALIRDELFLRSDVRAALTARFGAEVARADGTIDRTRLAALVFPDPAALADLEGIVHPPLFALWRERLSDPAAAGVDWVFEVPLLFEKGLEIWFDLIVCVGSASATQLRRLEQRGIPTALAAPRIAQQLPLSEKIARSDVLLWNDGTPEFLAAQVAHVVARVRPTARAGTSGLRS